ncbi:MAG: ATP synthase F1 subunit gamma [Deltaproteobacteria bacterium]|nr:ATP synthase F1 subunit gamma [Deltaproteobacteria bacterium]
MPSLKTIRKRIASVKSTQKITRAMKLVAGARLARAQQRITELRPYATKTQQVLADVTETGRMAMAAPGGGEAGPEAAELAHPLLVCRPEKRVMLVVLTSDRGLCGSFNANICRLAEQEWRRRTAQGQEVRMLVVGRKGRDYFRRRRAPMEHVDGVWAELGVDTARRLGRRIIEPYLHKRSIDAIYFVYDEFKSAVSQKVVVERLLPLPEPAASEAATEREQHEFLFEPDAPGLLDQLVPMYVQISILRALYESMASELGARMTAMEAATGNARDMIAALTLQYNRARQAAITKELMEIIGGAEALKG